MTSAPTPDLPTPLDPISIPLPASPPSRLQGKGQPPSRHRTEQTTAYPTDRTPSNHTDHEVQVPGSRKASRARPVGWVSTLPLERGGGGVPTKGTGGGGGVRPGRRVSGTMAYATGVWVDEDKDEIDDQYEGGEIIHRNDQAELEVQDAENGVDQGAERAQVVSDTMVIDNLELEDEWVTYVRAQLGKLFPDIHLGDSAVPGVHGVPGSFTFNPEISTTGVAAYSSFAEDGRTEIENGSAPVAEGGEAGEDVVAPVPTFRAELVSLREEIGRLRGVIGGLTMDLTSSRKTALDSEVAVVECTVVEEAEVVAEGTEVAGEEREEVKHGLQASGEGVDQSSVNEVYGREASDEANNDGQPISTESTRVIIQTSLAHGLETPSLGRNDRHLPEAFIRTARLSAKLVRALDKLAHLRPHVTGGNDQDENMSSVESVDNDNDETVFAASNLEALSAWLESKASDLASDRIGKKD